MTVASPAEARARARRQWAALRDRLVTVTPEAIGRGLLTLAVTALAVALAVGSWPALAPFVAGAVIAYAVLPIANRLDRFMPRVLAAVLAELVALGILAGVVMLIVPPLLRGLVQVAAQLPTQAEVQASLARLQESLGELEEPLRGIVLAVSTEVVVNLQAAINGFVDGMGDFVTQQILGIAGTLSFLLGLLVIPAWILTIVADERTIKRRAATVVAPGIRGDVVAVARIVDRAFGTFLRVRVLLAIVVGIGIWVGLSVAEALGIASYRYEVTAATLLGVLQLIPELGYFLGFFPIALVLAIQGPIPALTMVVVYVAANRIASGLVETRVSRGVLDVHPGLLIPAIVVLSQFGGLWLFAAAPLVSILRDTTRYLAGRLAEPPRPVNVLPGERPPRSRRTATMGARVPLVHRGAVPPAFSASRTVARAPAGPPVAPAPAPERSAAS